MDLTAFAETTDDQCHNEGRRLSRRALIDAAHAAGYEIGTKRATELMAHLAARRTATTESRDLAPTGWHTVAGSPPGNLPDPAATPSGNGHDPHVVTALGAAAPWGVGGDKAHPTNDGDHMADTTDPHADHGPDQ
jgi:hypothetical protein